MLESKDAVGNVQQAGPSPRAEQKGSSKLGKDEFVKLLMAQLGHQDPTSPVSSEAFVAQLAQFASVELQQSTNSHLENLMLAQASANQTAATNLIGKDVSYKTDAVTLTEGQAVRIDARLGAKADSVTAVISDADGKTVRTVQLGPSEAGALDLTWDGRDDNGRTLLPGTYKVRVTAAEKGGKAIDVEQRGQARVTGVSFEKGFPELKAGSASVKMSDIVEIKERNTP